MTGDAKNLSLREIAQRELERRLGADPAEAVTRPMHEQSVFDEELRIQAENLAAVNERLERELARSEAMFDEAPLVYLVLDENARILRANRAAGLALNTLHTVLRGQTMLGFVEPGSTEILLRHVQQALGGGRLPAERVHVSAAAAGSSMIWELHTSRWLHEGQRPACLMVCKDVTRLTAAELELEAAGADAIRGSHLKGRFLANMSHEVRTPLTLILGYVDSLRARDFDEEVARRLSVIDTAGRDLLHVLNDVVDFSKIEANQVTISLGVVDTDALFGHVADLFEGSGQLDDVVVTVTAVPEAPMPKFVSGDRARIVQVLINLISNAIRFSPPGGDVQVVYAYRSGNMVVTVQDAGPGIPPDQLDLVFEPFRQVDDSDRRNHGGAGLGLAISRQLVHLMRGELFARNTDRGACFTLQLPLAATTARGSESAGGLVARYGEAKRSDLRILLAEDDEEMRQLIEILLEDQGYSCDTSVNGAEALEQLTANEYDLVLMDIQMPVMDGLEAIGRIRASDQLSNLPVIALTARAIESEQDEIIEAGFSAYVPKPIDMERLLSAMLKLGLHQTRS